MILSLNQANIKINLLTIFFAIKHIFQQITLTKKENMKFITWNEFLDALINGAFIYDRMNPAFFQVNQKQEGQNFLTRGVPLHMSRTSIDQIVNPKDKQMIEFMRSQKDIEMPVETEMTQNEIQILQRLTEVDKRTHN